MMTGDGWVPNIRMTTPGRPGLRRLLHVGRVVMETGTGGVCLVVAAVHPRECGRRQPAKGSGNNCECRQS